MSDNRIKPCPFCGKAANIRQAPDVTHIYCATPACVAPLASAYSDGEAVAIWNRRMVEDELQDALDGMRGIAQQRQKRVEELEAASAMLRQSRDALLEQLERATHGQIRLEAQADWEPLEAGMTAILIKGLERYQRQIGRAEMQGWYSTNAARAEMERIESMIRGLRGSDDEPPTIRLCRRKEGR